MVAERLVMLAESKGSGVNGTVGYKVCEQADLRRDRWDDATECLVF